MATGLAEKSVSTDFEDTFAKFYLSDQTFLGKGGKVDGCCVSGACATDSCC